MKNIGNITETFLKEKGKSIEKIGKNTLQGMKTAGTAVKTFVKEEGKNFKIFLKTHDKNIKTGIKKRAVLAYKRLKKAPWILGQVIGQFTNRFSMRFIWTCARINRNSIRFSSHWRSWLLCLQSSWWSEKFY